jgi:alpha-tubulin suppressor-like RCC1 family protein
VIGGFTDWCQLSAGGQHSLGVRTNGTAWAWGNNTSGQLGDGTIVSKSSPVLVLGGFTDWCQVSAGTLHALAIRIL